MEIKIRYFGGLVLGLVAAGVSYYYLYEESRNLFYFILVLSLIAFVLPFMVAFLTGQKNQREKEAKFLEFSRDLVEGVKSGTPINKSIINLQKRDYGSLTPHVRKLANQIYFGINLDSAFTTFAKETKSKVISRAMTLISQAQKAGGKIESILTSVSSSVKQTEDLRKERKSSVYNLVLQGYIIFMVFIIIMLVLEYAILPLAAEFSENQIEGLNAGNTATEPLTQEKFAMPLFVMLLVQSVFAGLVIGKVSEGSIFGGVKHSFLLTTITLLVVTGTRAFLG
jgi:archaeal flagellar protein FlaJ